MSTITLVGRPNVGKSSLFNRLLNRSAAIVDNRPGVTRDRHYGRLVIEDREGLLVDTGGFELASENLAGPINTQIHLALEESDLVILVTDGQLGCHPRDQELADLVRRSGRPAVLAVNKIDSPEKNHLASEFYQLGNFEILPLSAAHGLGIGALKDILYQSLEPRAEIPEDAPPRIAVIGRPNAGKSSLINKLCGQNRLVVDSIPGTTRDAVDVTLSHNGKDYVLVDTAGMRRRGRVDEKLEKLSVLRALKSLERCDAAVLVIDAVQGLADQDAHIAGYAFERGRPVIILVNKWDLISEKKEVREAFQKALDLKLTFLEKTAPYLTVSALKGQGLSRLWPLVDQIMAQYASRAATADVNRVIQAAVEAHTPPQIGRGRLKFYYATQASTRPPSFVLFANRPEEIHFSYRRFLVNRLKEAFGLNMVPVRIFFRSRHEDWPEKPRKRTYAKAK
jgi:GTP-binding protein